MNKKKNVVTKFHGFWEKLNDHEQEQLWALLTALRGEDGGNRTVKRMTTCRIRAFMFPPGYQGKINGWVYTTRKYAETCSLSNEAKLSNLRKLFRGSNYHWRGHTAQAMQILEKLFPSKTKEFKKFMRWL